MTPSKLCALLGCTTLVAGDIWSDCSSSVAHLKNLNVSITPDPPVKGVKLNIGITGTLDEDLTAGSLNVWIKFLGIKIVNKHYDLCAEAAKTDTPCPIAAGAFNISIPESIPEATPTGHYLGQVSMADPKGEEVTCIDLDFKLH